MENKALLSAQEKNDIFAKASKEEKRIMIAHDVLAQIKATNIVPKNGTYFSPYTYSLDIPKTRKKRIELRELLPQIVDGGDCEVCAIGAMFFSAVAINNHCKLDVDKAWGADHEVDVCLDDDLLRQHLGKCFSQYQIALIEIAFEAVTLHMPDIVISKLTKKQEIEVEKAKEFKNNNVMYADNTETMIRIMQNIISNNGTFKP